MPSGHYQQNSALLISLSLSKGLTEVPPPHSDRQANFKHEDMYVNYRRTYKAASAKVEPLDGDET